MRRARVAAALLRGLRLLLLPSLRDRHGSEMEAMTRELLGEAFRRGWGPGLSTTGAELVDLVRTAWRLASPPGALAPTIATLALLLTLHLASAGEGDAFEVRFDGRDDAGSFTLVLRDGRAVAASLDGTPVPDHRIRQRGDSVVLIGADLVPDLRLLVDTPTSIRWESR